MTADTLREKLTALVEEIERDSIELNRGPRGGKWRTAAAVLNGVRLRLAAILAESEEPEPPEYQLRPSYPHGCPMCKALCCCEGYGCRHRCKPKEPKPPLGHPFYHAPNDPLHLCQLCGQPPEAHEAKP